MATRTIVLIHGLSVSKHSWERWKARYESRGHTVVTPAYHPDLDKPLAALQASPNDPILSSITLPQVVEHLVQLIRALPEKPIVMGHSFGGMLTQLMLQRDLAVAGVAVDSVAPSNIKPTQWSLVKSIWPALNPLIPATRSWHITLDQFRYSWAHTQPPAEQRMAWESIIVPESRGLYRSGLTKDARVDFARRRAPLLLIGGAKDHLMPAALNRMNYKRYAKSPSVTEYKEFPGRTHYTVVAGPGWEEVADYALAWASQAADSAPRP